MINPKYKYLKTQNDWNGKIPEEYKKCVALKHKRTHTNGKNGETKTECNICCYYFFSYSDD